MARPGEIDANKDPVTEKGDKPHPLFQKWLDLLVIAFNNFRRVRDLTSVTSDYRLLVGESVKINITTASTPLNIAVEDGVYEIRVIFDHTTFAADSSFGLQINNADQTGAVMRCRIRGATDIATDEVDVIDTAVDQHLNFTNSRFIQVVATVMIMGAISSAEGRVFTIDVTSNVEQIAVGGTRWGGTHTSLGTIALSEAATGVCYVRRTA